MSFRNPWKPNTRSNEQRQKGGRILFFVLLAVMIGWLVFEPFYVRHHLPLIAAELAKVEREGPDLLEQIGAPTGSTRSETMEKSVTSPNFKSKWHGVSNSLQPLRPGRCRALPRRSASGMCSGCPGTGG
jgi:hypothetical protein